MLLTLLQSGGAPIDHFPFAIGDAYGTAYETILVVPAGTGVLANDTGLQDAGLVVTVIGAVVGGSLLLNDDGSFTFTPTAGFSGAASFTYRVTDADGDWAEANVVITVAAPVVIPPTIDYPYRVTAGNVGGGFSRRQPSSRRVLHDRHRQRQRHDDRDVLALVHKFLAVMEG